MKVTDLSPQKKDPKRVNVYLDSAFAFGVSQEIRITKQLKIGQELTQKEVDALILADQTGRLYDKAINFLSSRPRSKREIEQNLLQKLKITDKADEEKKNFPTSIANVIKKLEKVGLVNDLEFAKWWFEQRTKFKKASPRIIKSELKMKGIDKETVEAVVAELAVDPYHLALEAGKKKLSSYQKLSPEDFKIKMGRYLAARGFDWEIVKKAVDTMRDKA